jgi:hypothetical protein
LYHHDVVTSLHVDTPRKESLMKRILALAIRIVGAPGGSAKAW